MRIKQKCYAQKFHKFSENFEFGEFSVKFRQTVGYFYFELDNPRPTFLASLSLKVPQCFKMVTEYEVQYTFLRSKTAFDGPRTDQSNCEFVSCGGGGGEGERGGGGHLNPRVYLIGTNSVFGRLGRHGIHICFS